LLAGIAPWLAVQKLPEAEAREFREQHNKSIGKAWCIYSHRTPQGDVSEHSTGWGRAYV